jgi:uncharacterized protein
MSDPAVRLLLWNEHDIAARLADVLVAETDSPPSASLESLLDWLDARCGEGEESQAIYLTMLAPGQEKSERDRITEIRTLGYGVFIKPAQDGATPDLGAAAVAQVNASLARGDIVSEVLVATHDGALRSQLEGLAARGITVTVLGFREEAGFAAESSQLGFVDVEDTGAFGSPLPRTNLYDVPAEGLSLPPLRRGKRAPVAVAAEVAAPDVALADDAAIAAVADAAVEAAPVADEAPAATAAVADAAMEASPAADEAVAEAAPAAEEAAVSPAVEDAATLNPPAPPEVPHSSVGLYPSRSGSESGALAGSPTSPWSLDPNRPGRVSPPNGAGA